MIEHYISPSMVYILRSCKLRFAMHYGYLSDYDKKRLSAMGYEISIHGKVKTPLMDYNFFGDLMHHMFQQFFDKNYKSKTSFTRAGYGEWDRRMKNAISRYGGVIFRNKKKWIYHERVKTILPIFFDENLEEKTQLHETEVKFNMPIERPHHIIIINGRRDRITTKPDGSKRVTDYKTGHHRGDEFDVRKNPQFATYSMVTEFETKKRPEIELYIPGRGDPETLLKLENNRKDFESKVISLGINSSDKADLIVSMEKQRRLYEKIVGTQAKTVKQSHEFTSEDHKIIMDMFLECDSDMTKLKIEISQGKQIEPTYGPDCMVCPYSYWGACDAYTDANKFSYLRKNLHMEHTITPPIDSHEEKPKKKKTIKGQLNLKFPKPEQQELFNQQESTTPPSQP